MQLYAESLTEYKRLATLEVKVGDLLLGNFNPIRIQTMTTTDTMDTVATVEQSIRCIEAGSELIRITAPSKKEAENLLNIKNELRTRGYHTPIVADIHFTPNAAEIAARIVEKVRVNPGNYVDKKKFELLEYSDAEYLEEIERIRDRFTPLVKICKEYGTAMRIGTNHGSLSDRIMSRYGDTPIGMVESAMEFLRIAESENYYNIVLSMKSSNPQVMVQAYRLLIQNMHVELGHCYPLHLGVTEAGDGEDGRIKSAIGIGTLLEDGIGDTIRVSLTEDPEFEIPVCKNIVKRYSPLQTSPNRGDFASTQSRSKIREGNSKMGEISKSLSLGEGFRERLSYNPFEYKRRKTFEVSNIGSKHVPVVIADLHKIEKVSPEDMEAIGYTYDVVTDKWNISDAAADYIFTADKQIDFALPGTLKVICYYKTWLSSIDKEKYLPIFDEEQYLNDNIAKSAATNFVMIDCYSEGYSTINAETIFSKLKQDKTAVVCLSSANKNAVQSIRRMFVELIEREIKNPVVIITDSTHQEMDESLIHYAIETGALLLDGFGDGICLGHRFSEKNVHTDYKLLNSIAFGILQATRTRISKTEYISCPSCGRTLFDLQETTAKIRAVTNHLKGVKIAIMGCIVNGPGEMADADFGYVGSGPGKVTLYKGKEVIKRSVSEDVAVSELINLIKENEAWVEPVTPIIS
ncbi:MAG: (E)-4-hydroxy-3-methylbut-2-enyl-diphosphate synthase [Bacteroidota bacterium]|nr:(E)-4-hydroxy-3-methylbut-2-enyl-diphosphate synthase [Bacteroidota bacterium]